MSPEVLADEPDATSESLAELINRQIAEERGIIHFGIYGSDLGTPYIEILVPNQISREIARLMKTADRKSGTYTTITVNVSEKYL